MKTCPKCSYVRKSTDAKVPDWQCPSCGIAYAKFEAQPNPARAASRGPVVAGPNPAPMSAKALFFILAGLIAAGYFGYQKFMAPKGAAEEAGDSNVLQASHPAYYGTKEAGGVVLRMKPETLAELRKLTPSKVVMFGTAWCPYCAKAREVFARQGVRYSELDLEKDSTAAAFQQDVMGLQGFPTIVIGNRVTQGFDEREILAGLKEL